MRVLVVDGFLPTSAGRRAFRSMKKALRKCFKRVEVEFGVAHITTLALSDLGSVLFDETPTFPDPDSLGRFAAFDLFIVDGDPLTLPWMKAARPARVLVKMCLAAGKSLFCGQFATQVLVYVLSTGGRELVVVNGAGKGSSMAAARAASGGAIRNNGGSRSASRGRGGAERSPSSTRGYVVSPTSREARRAARAMREAGDRGEEVFLDSLSGDVYTQDGAEWLASGNMGIYLHRGRTEHARWGKGGAAKGGTDLLEVVCRSRKRQIGHWALRDIARQFSVGKSGRWVIQEAASRGSATRYVVLAERNANPRPAPLLIEVGCCIGAHFHLTERWPQTGRIFGNFVRHRCGVMMNVVGRSHDHELLLKSAPPMRTGLAKARKALPRYARAKSSKAAACQASAASKRRTRSRTASSKTTKTGTRGTAAVAAAAAARVSSKRSDALGASTSTSMTRTMHSSQRPRASPPAGRTRVHLAARTNAMDGASKSHAEKMVPLTSINQGTTPLFPTSRFHANAARVAWEGGRKSRSGGRSGNGGHRLRPSSAQSSPVLMGVSAPRGGARLSPVARRAASVGSPDRRVVQQPSRSRSPYSSWGRRKDAADEEPSVMEISISSGTKYTTPQEKAAEEYRVEKAKRITDKPFYRHSGVASGLKLRGAGGSNDVVDGAAVPVAFTKGAVGDHLFRGPVEKEKFVDPKGWF